MATIYLDRDGNLVTSTEFWRGVERVSLEGDRTDAQRFVGRDFAQGAADDGFTPYASGHSGWRSSDPDVGCDVSDAALEEPEAIAGG
jgi:hypothetical protein